MATLISQRRACLKDKLREGEKEERKVGEWVSRKAEAQRQGIMTKRQKRLMYTLSCAKT